MRYIRQKQIYLNCQAICKEAIHYGTTVWHSQKEKIYQIIVRRRPAWVGMLQYACVFGGAFTPTFHKTGMLCRQVDEDRRQDFKEKWIVKAQENMIVGKTQ